ncbi:MAG: Sir2 family NAD-dependent protein deacetylase [Vicinamibacterales bacterium]|nr:Sir2 family NAD-dependent protein deacetylase [Vicinamibacterales bacterium]
MDLVQLLRDADRILVFTGAGVSTGSGIRDFRGPTGVWTERQPVYFQDFMSSAAARIEYWDQKCQAWPSFRDAEPNAVHTAIADLERAGKLAMVITQNIDGLHSRGGTSAERLVELHGTNAAIECMSCHARSTPDSHMQSFSDTRQPPVCGCGGYLKPATISFGQNLDPDDLARAAAAVQETDLVVALGSTLSVHPAAGFPLAAAQRGVPYVVVNRGVTDHDGHSAVTLRLDGDVVELFPPAVAEALAASSRSSCADGAASPPGRRV